MASRTFVGQNSQADLREAALRHMIEYQGMDHEALLQECRRRFGIRKGAWSGLTINALVRLLAADDARDR